MTGGESATIHSMLELKSYTKDYATPKALTCDYLIVDEFSMVDMQICQYLFMAASSKTRVIILGDHNQLPSVGPGLVLRDMIDVKIFPVVTLTRVFRQDVQRNPAELLRTPTASSLRQMRRKNSALPIPKSPERTSTSWKKTIPAASWKPFKRLLKQQSITIMFR